VADHDVLVRLRALSDETFRRFVAEVAEAVAPDAAVTVAPPSPAGGVDAVVESVAADRRRLLHVRRQADPGPADPGVTDETDAPGRADADRAGAVEVPPFAADDLREILAVGESFDAVVVAVAGPVTAEARRSAESAGVRLLDGDDLLSLVRRSGITVPTPESVAERFHRLVERQASEWPQPTRDLASRVLAEIEAVADFDHRIVHADGTTDVDFLLARDGEPDGDRGADGDGTAEPHPAANGSGHVVRVRLTETEFLVYVVGPDDQFAAVGSLSAIAEDDQTTESVIADVVPAVRAAVDRHR
jgi:hypothetical protein